MYEIIELNEPIKEGSVVYFKPFGLAVCKEYKYKDGSTELVIQTIPREGKGSVTQPLYQIIDDIKPVDILK